MPMQVMLPSGRVTTVDTDDPKIAAATARAFVQRDPYESARAWLNDRPVRKGTYGGEMTVARAIPFLSEASAGLGAAVDTAGDALSGKKADFGRSWTKQRALQQAEVDSFKEEHPILSGASTAVGNMAPVAAAIATGGLSAAPSVAAETPEAGSGIAGLLKAGGARAGRRALAGGGAGYVSGVSQPGTLKERLASGNRGAMTGAAIGTLAPPILDVVGGAAVKAASKTGMTLTRAANKASGGAILDANRTAAQRLTASLRADGATPELIRQAMNGYLKNGATDPALIDIASKLPSGGQNTLALVRGAAMTGGGRASATKYAEQVASDLQDKAIARTRKLTPDEPAPATAVRAKAVTARKVAADRDYAAPYATPVDAAPVLPALEGNTGRRAISAARGDADALRLGDQMSELDKLRAAAGPEEETPAARIGGDELPTSPSLAAKIQAAMAKDDGSVPVSLGTLDRTKIALREAADTAARAGNAAQAKGLSERAREIDDHLASVNPDYATARDNYAKASAGIDALDHGATGVTAVPDDYAANLHDFLTRGGPDAGKMAAVGYRQSLTDALGAPTENAKGAMNRVSTSTNQGRNLAATFGDEEADAYRGDLKDIASQGRLADFINPHTGSTTAGRLTDLGLVDPGDIAPVRLSPLHIVLGAINKINRGATLTDAERKAIVDIGTSRANPESLDLSSLAKVRPSPAIDDLRAYMAAISTQDDGQKRATTP